MTTKKSTWFSLKWTNNATVGTVLGGVILAVAGYFYHLSSRIDELAIDVAKIKQRLADGGTHEIVSQLDGVQTVAQASANMQVIKAQVSVARAEGKPPDESKIKLLVPAVTNVARKFPEVDDSWAAISALSSYRTASARSASSSSPLPDCVVQDAQPRVVLDEEIGIPGSGSRIAYFFRDCLLHLNHLPGKRMETTLAKDALSPSGVIHKAGEKLVLATPLLAFECVIVYGADGQLDPGSDVPFIEAIKCEFDFNVQHTPSLVGRGLLLASLGGEQDGLLKLPLR